MFCNGKRFSRSYTLRKTKEGTGCNGDLSCLLEQRTVTCYQHLLQSQHLEQNKECFKLGKRGGELRCHISDGRWNTKTAAECEQGGVWQTLEESCWKGGHGSGEKFVLASHVGKRRPRRVAMFFPRQDFCIRIPLHGATPAFSRALKRGKYLRLEGV